MAGTKISALTAAAALADADQLPIAQSGVTKSLTGVLMRTAVGGGITNNSGAAAAQTPAATTRTYLAGSAIAVPVGKLRIGSFFRWEFDITKTGAGSAASTIDVAVGTAGTTADTARLSFTKPAGTAVIDEGYCIVTALVRGPLSASGVMVGEFVMYHNLQITGHATIPVVCVNTVSGAFDVTVASLIVGLCITTGAADVITIQFVTAQAWNL